MCVCVCVCVDVHPDVVPLVKCLDGENCIRQGKLALLEVPMESSDTTTESTTVALQEEGAYMCKWEWSGKG